jgi:hypothetical protein
VRWGARVGVMRRNFHHQWPKVTSALMGCKEGREGDTISVEQSRHGGDLVILAWIGARMAWRPTGVRRRSGLRMTYKHLSCVCFSVAPSGEERSECGAYVA